VSARSPIPPEISRVASELAAADDLAFAEGFRRAWPEALAAALAAAAVVPLDRKPALSLEEASALTGYSVSTLSRLVASGALSPIPHVRGRTVIARKELDRWLDSTVGATVSPARKAVA
jgi:predicted DNA-binding transcriptional regulator AlpA